MSTFTRTLTETFHVVTCYTCGTAFGINDQMYRRAVKNKEGSVYCPACRRGSCWTDETEEEKRIKQLTATISRQDQRLEDLRQRHETTKNVLRATKGVVTRTKNRISKGVCPCCNRHFKNLAQHMINQHPEYTHETKS